MIKGWEYLAAALLVVGLAGCERVDEQGRPVNEGELTVVATTSVVADLVEQIAGDHVEVIGLMGPGVDPHLYRASEGDVERMAGADIVFYNGFHLEGRMSELLAQMADRGTATVPVAEVIDPSELLTPPEFEGAYDPHVWMDVAMWRRTPARVAEALAEMDPDNADSYRTNAETFTDKLTELDQFVRTEVERIPENLRVLVTAHDAFNYFGRSYGFEVRGLQGISTVAEAGTADVQELSRFVAERQIPAIFVESSVSPRSIEAVRAAVRARSFEVEVGGNLFSDALGGEGSGAEDYEGMIRHNIMTIANALSRDVE